MGLRIPDLAARGWYPLKESAPLLYPLILAVFLG